MAANTFLQLPSVAADGAGPAVDVSALGAAKSIFVGGLAANDPQLLIIEGANAAAPSDSDFAPVAFLQLPKNFASIKVVARFMRVRVLNFLTGVSTLANVFVGANDASNIFAVVPTPVGNGVGTALNTASLGDIKTLYIGGLVPDDPQTITIEGADDPTPNESDFAPIARIQQPKNFDAFELTTQFIRIRVEGFVPGVSGTATANLGAQEPAGSGAGGLITDLIYQPGGAADPSRGIFTTEATLYAALNALGPEVQKSIQFRDNIVSPIVLTTGNDMTNTRWKGRDSDGNSFGGSATVEMADGTSFPNLLTFGPNLNLLNRNTVTSPVILSQNDQINLETNVDLSTVAGGVAMFDASGIVVAFIVSFLKDVCTYGLFDSGPVILFGSGGIAFNLLGEGCNIETDVLSGPFDGAIVNRVISSGGSINDQSGTFPGFVTRILNARPAYLFNPRPPATAVGPVGSAVPNDIIPCDVSGGAFNQGLPDIGASGFKAEGMRVTVLEISGTAGLTVGPSGTDTINGVGGVAGRVAVPAGGAVVFVSDGTGNWRTAGSYEPGGDTWVFGADNIASGADTRFLAMGSYNGTVPTSSDFGWRAPRAGLLRNFRVRHNAVSGNGNAVVYDVQVGGVAAGLGISLVSGAIGDASDLVSTVAVAAGDLIEATATKALSIGAGAQQVQFSMEFI